MKSVGIIGPGRVGSAMAYALDNCGYRVVVVSRKVLPGGVLTIRDRKYKTVSLAEISKEADTLLITTPDGKISEIVKQLQVFKLEKKVILQMSGSYSSAILASLQAKGALCGSLHPLQSFATVEQAIENLPGSYFTYEGDETLLENIKILVKELGGVLKTLPSPEAKAVYHAGACIVSNYLVALAWLGTQCLSSAGFTAEEAREALVPLMQGTLNNISSLPLTKALTGPISRGDSGVVENHVRILSREIPDINRAYCNLAPYLAKLALAGGNITEEKYKRILEITRGGKKDE
jgi:predicted short-subunit dehydrogenase-like oxidoreductase (DUF2520 family)